MVILEAAAVISVVSSFASLFAAKRSARLAKEMRKKMQLLHDDMTALGNYMMTKLQSYTNTLKTKVSQLRAFDPKVFGLVKGVTCDSVCQRTLDRGLITSTLSLEREIPAVVFGHSRYNIGNRSEAAEFAIARAIDQAAIGAGIAYNQSDLVDEACKQLKYTSMASVSTMRDMDLSSGFTHMSRLIDSAKDTYQKQITGANAAYAASKVAMAQSLFAIGKGIAGQFGGGTAQMGSVQMGHPSTL